MIIFSLVMILFGPVFLISTIGMTILYFIMPEGWDKFDDE